jgi:4-hydroxybenzoate polyprenyltransferase
MDKRILPFIIYSNLFIAVCALALTFETFCLLHLPGSLNWYLLLMFFCTLFVYSLHYFVKSKKEKTDSRLQWCRNNLTLLLTIIILSFIFIAGGVIWHYQYIFIRNGQFNYRNVIWFIIIPLLALGYSYPLNPWNKKSLRQIGWLKMASLSFIWSFTTVVLPVLMLHGNIHNPEENIQVIMLFIHRFFFIASLGFLFNINDYEEDKKDGIKTIAVWLGPSKSIQYGKWIMLFINIITAALLLYYFELTHPAFYGALLIPVIQLFLLYSHFSAQKEEAEFVFRYDGLMIVKAMLLIFAVLTFST